MGCIKKASIALIVLLDGDLVDSPEHLGVSILAACLREHGHDSKIFDVAPDQDENVIQAILDMRPDMAGLSLTTVNLTRAKQFGDSLRRKLNKDSPILLGGPVATFCGSALFSNSNWEFADGIVRGEADHAIVQIAEKLASKMPLIGINGLQMRGAEPSVIPVASVRQIDKLPWPVRDQLEEHGSLPYLRLSTTRGCTSACTFCNAPHAGNNIASAKLWRQRSPSCILKEIQHLNKTYGATTFDFVDSTFEDPSQHPKGKQRVQEIAEAILSTDLSIYFNICSQAINWHEDDKPLIKQLVKAGLEKVLIGVESGYEPALRRYGKRATVEDNTRAISLFASEGVYVAFGFIMFDPLGTFEELYANTKFLHQHIGHNLRRFLTRLELYPGAQVIDNLRNENLLGPNYESELNPYDYKYLDDRIRRLADAMSAIISDDYMHDGTALIDSPVVKFETFSIETHTFISRLLRRYSNTDFYVDIASAQSEIKQIYRHLSDVNYDMFTNAIKCAEQDLDFPDNIKSKIDQEYVTALSLIRTIKIRLGMKLSRAGLPLSQIRTDRLQA